VICWRTIAAKRTYPRVRVVAELAALVRPWGVVALQEVDWVSWICQPPYPAWNRLRDALRDFRARRGLDVRDSAAS
jgi:hypothetical protein